MLEELHLISADAFREAFSRIYDLFVRRKEGYDLSKNDFSDEYRKKLDVLENYMLPPATDKVLGGVIAGSGLSVDDRGRVSVDFSKYVTFSDIKKDNRATELRFTKIENAAKQKQREDLLFKNTTMAKIGSCDSKLDEVKKNTEENSKRFDNYVTRAEHDADRAGLQDELANKVDIETLDKTLKRKVTKSDLDGNLNNLLDVIRTEQNKAAIDRDNLRQVKSDITSLNNLRQLVKANSQDISYISQDMQKFITADALKGYVAAEPGMGLSERNFTNADWDKLHGLYNYTLPPASKASIGGVKAGDNVDIADDGTISINVPTVKEFIKKEDSQKITDALNIRLTDCENKTTKLNDTLNTMSSSLSAAKDKVGTLESKTQEHALLLPTLATKTELTNKFDTLNKNKVSVEEFERHVATKLSADKLDVDINNKLDSTLTMSVDITSLQAAMKNAEADVVRCFDRIKRLNSLITAIRNDIPDSNTYVRVRPNKGLSTNDFTNAQKNRLASALTADDIGVRVVGVGADNKIDSKYLPEDNKDIQYVDNINVEFTGETDVLYFNRADKKLYYYDGANFQKVRDNFYNDQGVDIRTEMEDLYLKKFDDFTTSCGESITNIKDYEVSSKESKTKAKESEFESKKSAETAKKWAMSTESPDGEPDGDGKNGTTQSSKVWALESKAQALEATKQNDEVAKNTAQVKDALKQVLDSKSAVDTVHNSVKQLAQETKRLHDSIPDAVFYKGSVETYAELPAVSTGVKIGHMYNVQTADKAHGVKAGDNVVWNGSEWDNFGGYIDVDDILNGGKDATFGAVKATSFTGELVGNANTATKATTADRALTADVCTGNAATASSVAWGDVTGKPATYPATAHSHAWANITGAPATATRWPAWGEVTGKPALIADKGTYSTVYANDWFRANGNCGFYFQKWGGGWYMTDATWIRAYGNKNIYTTGIIQGGKVYNAVYNDYAEFFEKEPETVFEPGDIIALDENSDKERYVKATSDSNIIVGVCTDEYAHIIGGNEGTIEENEKDFVPVSLMGRVHVKVKGDIHIGDRITASEVPGVGRKAEQGETSIGTVLSRVKDGKARVLVGREL